VNSCETEAFFVHGFSGELKFAQQARLTVPRTVSLSAESQRQSWIVRPSEEVRFPCLGVGLSPRPIVVDTAGIPLSALPIAIY